MKKIALLFLAAVLTTSCNSQENKKEDIENEIGKKKITEQPKGTWKVDKEFDQDGNLIRYDSIYSWSSSDDFETLNFRDKDSLLQSFQSRFFQHFSDTDRFGIDPFMAPDSLFNERFFNRDFFGSDFGKDFMDIDKMHQRMERMQNEFIERYRPRFDLPEDENDKAQL